MHRSGPRDIFIGTADVGGFAHALGEGFRELGHTVTTGLSWLMPHYDYEYDLYIEPDPPVDWARVERLARDRSRVPVEEIDDESTPLERILWVIDQHDLFVFVFASLAGDAEGPPLKRGLGRDFSLLKELGKQVVVVCTGYEVRHALAYDQDLRRRGLDGSVLMRVGPAAVRLPLERALRNLRRAELFADLVLSTPEMSALALRPYMHLFAPVDVRGIRPRFPDRERPLVVHAPSDMAAKGTRFLIGAMEGLYGGDAYRCELRILHGAPHKDVLRAFREADIVVDQLLLPHGTVGVEAMASGSALACFDPVELDPFPSERPIWHLDIHDVRERLGRLLGDRDLRRRLGREGRRYALRHHDRVSVARAILERLDAGPEAPMDHQPDFFARAFERPEGFVLPPDLAELNRRVIERWGLPDDASQESLVRRGWLA